MISLESQGSMNNVNSKYTKKKHTTRPHDISSLSTHVIDVLSLSLG